MSIFVDTGAWYASVVPNDPMHVKIMAWHRQNTQRLLTTDFVLDETLTLLRSRGERTRALAFGRQLLDLGGVDIHFLDPSEFTQAWILFRDHPARDWSFTDCTSKIVMDAFHIKQVATLDHHFAEFGGFELIP